MNQELNYYMNLSYRMEIVEDKDEGGYVLSLSLIHISEPTRPY